MDCSICISPIQSTEIAVVMDCCTKQYHESCYKKWTMQQLSARRLESCPDCRGSSRSITDRINTLFQQYSNAELPLVMLSAEFRRMLAQQPSQMISDIVLPRDKVAMEIWHCFFNKCFALMKKTKVKECTHPTSELCQQFNFKELSANPDPRVQNGFRKRLWQVMRKRNVNPIYP